MTLGSDNPLTIYWHTKSTWQADVALITFSGAS
jgi:hypothetical protein